MNLWTMVSRTLSEGDNHPNEDACGFAGNTAWVIDGATSILEQLDLPASSDPGWYSAALAVELSAAAGLAGTRAVLAEALRQIDVLGNTLVGEERVRFPSAAVSLAQLSFDPAGECNGVEVLSLADCHVVVRERGGDIKHVVAALADPGAPTMGRLELAASRRRRNTPAGLWVARREPEAAEHALLVRCAAPELITLASDGAWRAVDLGLVAGPAEFLDVVSAPVGALELQTALRRHQASIGEKADDATILTLKPASLTLKPAGR